MNASVRQDRVSTLRAFAKQTGISFPILTRADHLFRVYGRQHKMPLEVIIDRDGRIALMEHRFDIQKLRRTIQSLLQRPSRSLHP